MAFLFVTQDRAVFPNTETLLIYPFKEIWARDKTKDKSKALEDLAYIEFMTSMKKSNPYRQYQESEKHEKIFADVITQNKWQPDGLIKDGIQRIHEFQTGASTTYSYYLAAKRAAEKMQNFFNEVDINAVNPKTMAPLYKPRDITSALNDTGKLLAELKALEKKVEEELFEETKTKAGKEISPFADRNSIT